MLAGRPADRRDLFLRFDLTEVTSIDAAGRACLEALHRQGAEFVAADCLMKAVVAEITGASDRAEVKPVPGFPVGDRERRDVPPALPAPPTRSPGG